LFHPPDPLRAAPAFARLPTFPDGEGRLKDLAHRLCPDCYRLAMANPALVKAVLWLESRELGAHGALPAWRWGAVR